MLPSRLRNFRSLLRPLAVAMLLAVALPNGGRDASAGGGQGGAAASAGGGLSACSGNASKALYDCVANELDKLSNDISGVPSTQGALRSAALKLRSATTKAQALSAISQCRALISAAIQKVRSIGSAQGWAADGGDGGGLQAVSGVLGRAAALIQSKG